MTEPTTTQIIRWLSELAAPSRELDGYIGKMVGCEVPAPHYTASVDDALSLIQQNSGGEEWLLEMKHFCSRGDMKWSVSAGNFCLDAIDEVYHTSLPIAICIVAIMARNEQGLLKDGAA